MSEATKVEEKTVEVTDSTAPEAAAAPVLPTPAEMKAQGWSAKEIESAQKRGMVAEKVEDKKPEAKPAEVKPPEAKPADEPAKPKSSLPNFDMTPEQEKVFFETFGPGTAPRAMYVGMKAERRSRQIAEQRLRDLEIENRTLKEIPKPAGPVDDMGVDLEDQPLTLRQLKELQKLEAEAAQKAALENASRSTEVVAAQTEQEEYARGIYADFDATVLLAKEVLTNLDEIVPEKWRQTKAVKLARDLQVAAANADKFGLDEYHAAMIAYELGQLHPKYGKTEPPAPKPAAPKVDGNLNPEQMKRVEKNTQLRSASAAIPAGGGKRTMSVDDIDLKTLNGMPYAERKSFREKHPEKYARLMRG